MHSQTKATAIPKSVKMVVGERDNWSCIICHRPGLPEAHYIRRSQGGLGIEQNVVTLCRECHDRFDNGDKRFEYGQKIRAYLDEQYPYFDNKDRYYDRWKYESD